MSTDQSTDPLTDELFHSFVPHLLLRHLAAGVPSPSTPTLSPTTAAVLFADISGFTALSGQLARHGPAGAETLTQILDDYFGRLIALILAHRGDVGKFAGDGVLVLWPTSPVRLGEAVTQAAHAALAIRGGLADYRTESGERLRLRLGVGAGEMTLLTLGGVEGRWEFLLRGDAVRQASSAEQQARPGEVVLSAEAAAFLNCQGEKLPGGALRLTALAQPAPPSSPKPDAARLAATRLGGFIPDTVRVRLAAGQGGWLAELRPVTVLFIHLPVLAQDGPLANAQTTMQVVQEVLYHYEGTINKISVDEKGASVLAAFGLPPLAHEDDATRGVRAAHTLQMQFAAQGVPVAIGVASGRVFCGLIGPSTRREYTMLGTTVNLAARLMQAAGTRGGILCDQATMQASIGRAAFTALPPMRLKGWAEPVPVYQPIAPSAVSAEGKGNAGPAMVGREAERAVLAEYLDALESGTSGVLLIEGEAGIGKSRLVTELLRQAEGRSLSVLVGAADATLQATAYLAWRPIFQTLVGLDADFSADQQRARLIERLDDAARAPLLGEVLGLELPDTPLTALMQGEVRADNTRQLLVGLLAAAAAAHGPLLVVLEDVHWLDSASWALVQASARRAAPLLLVLVSRPPGEPLPEDYRRLLARSATRRLPLGPLPPADVEALVCARLSVERLPEPVVALLRAKAEGHPFFSEELAYALRDAGLLVITGGACELAPDAGDLRELGFPDTVQGVITSRIDRLEPTAQLALKVASVIGRVFARQVLEAIYPLSAERPRLGGALEELARRDLTPLETPEPELTYLFKHIITQEVAYNLMLFAQRRALHAALAGWYEEAYAGHLAPYYALLAHHWGQAGEPTRQLAYLEQAGDAAMRAGVYPEAVGFFQQALALPSLPNAPTRMAHWERQLGEAWLALGQYPTSQAHLARAVALLGWPLPVGHGQIPGILRALAQQVVHRLRGVRPPADADEQQRVQAAAQSYEILFQLVSAAGGEPLMLLYMSLQAANLAERSGLPDRIARSLAMLGAGIGLLIPAAGRAYLQRAGRIAQRAEDPVAQAWVGIATVISEAGWGHLGPALRAEAQAAAGFGQAADHLRWEAVRDIGCFLLLCQGRFQEGLALAQHVQAEMGPAEAELPPRAWWTLLIQGEVRLRFGELAEAATCTEQALRVLLAHGHLGAVNEIWAYGLLAHIRLAEGASSEARRLAAEALARIERGGLPPVWMLPGYVGVVEVSLSLWKDGAEGRSTAWRSCLALTRLAGTYPLARPATWCGWGRYAWLAGHSWGAQVAWGRAGRAAARLGMPYWQAVAHYEQGHHLPVGSPARAEHLNQAATIFTRLGAAPDAARAHQGGRHFGGGSCDE